MAGPVVLAWPLKRLALSTLARIASGELAAPAGAELLVSTAARPVQVTTVPGAESERITITGAPLRATFQEITAEAPDLLTETCLLEFRVSVLEPGEDVDAASKALADLCQAVVAAISGTTLTARGRVWLSGVSESPPAFTPNPEPSVRAEASVIFAAEVVSNA